jgi:DNA-binding MarR family transcriptional regulator
MIDKDLALAVTRAFGLKNAIFRGLENPAIEPQLGDSQKRVLMIAWRLEGVPMQALSREAGLEKGSLTAVVDTLESLDLVERVRQDDDRRSFTVKPTPRGAELARKIDARFRSHVESVLVRLDPAERARFVEAIRTIARDLSLLSD